MSQQFGQRLTRDQANALGIDNQVLSQLVAGAVLDEQARKLGLGLSKDRLAELTWDDPTFRGADGKFDRQAFEYILRQIGMRPEDYLKNRAQVAVRQQIVEAVSDGLEAPDTFLRAVALYPRRRSHHRLPAAAQVARRADRGTGRRRAQGLVRGKQEELRRPEFRKLSYVKLEPEDIMDAAAVTEEQARQDYDKNKSHFTTAETRKIDQLVLSADAAKAASDAIKGGATFDKVVADQGKTAADVALGSLTKDRIADKAVAEAAFALQASRGERGRRRFLSGRCWSASAKSRRQRSKSLRRRSTPEIRRDMALAEANAHLARRARQLRGRPRGRRVDEALPPSKLEA
jgi:peptidyl-prolyl cis-trans isomerase D